MTDETPATASNPASDPAGTIREDDYDRLWQKMDSPRGFTTDPVPRWWRHRALTYVDYRANDEVAVMRLVAVPVLDPAGTVSVPLPTPTPTTGDREALWAKISAAFNSYVSTKMHIHDVPDGDDVAAAVMPVVDELRAEIEQLRAERAQIVAALDGFQLVDGDCGQPSGTLVQHVAALRGELATTREERDEAKRNYDDQMQIRMEVEKVLDDALGSEEDDGAGMGLVGDVALLADRLKQAKADLAEVRPRTAVEALRQLREQEASLVKQNETEFDYGYRSAYSRICDWLEHEFKPLPVSPAVPEDPATPTRGGE